MNPAVLSLAALILALALSMSSRMNVRWLALAFAWLIGVYQAGLRPVAVMAGFPVTLFLTLTGSERGQTGVKPGSDQGQTPEPLLLHQQLTVVVIAA